MLQSLRSLVRLTQFPSTTFPVCTVGVTDVRHATYRAHAIQCNISPYNVKKNITILFITPFQ